MVAAGWTPPLPEHGVTPEDRKALLRRLAEVGLPAHAAYFRGAYTPVELPREVVTRALAAPAFHEAIAGFRTRWAVPPELGAAGAARWSSLQRAFEERQRGHITLVRELLEREDESLFAADPLHSGLRARHELELEEIASRFGIPQGSAPGELHPLGCYWLGTYAFTGISEEKFIRGAELLRKRVSVKLHVNEYGEPLASITCALSRDLGSRFVCDLVRALWRDLDARTPEDTKPTTHDDEEVRHLALGYDERLARRVLRRVRAKRWDEHFCRHYRRVTGNAIDPTTARAKVGKVLLALLRTRRVRTS